MNVERKIFCFWTGENEMSTNRRACLNSIVAKSNCEVELVTSDNLGRFVLNHHPLHEAYEFLSYTHRSDYLRCYFMRTYLKIEMMTFPVVWYARAEAPRRSMGKVQKHFPEENISASRPGRKPIHARRVLEAALWILTTGAQWHMLPQGYPNYKGCSD